MPNLFTRLFGGRTAVAELSRDASTGTETKAARMLVSWRDLGAPDWTRRSFAALAQEGYARNPVVNRCVRLIAESANRVPMVAVEDDRRLSEHPLLALLRRPNPHQSGSELLESVYAYLQTAGNAYLSAAIVDGEVKGIFGLRPDRMAVVDGAVKKGSLARIEPEGRVVRMWEAIETYLDRRQPLIVIAGADYGQGSSRDWAAKGVRLAGVETVVAEGFERIHRTNLIGMGVLPLEFRPGTNRLTLQLDGTETYDVEGARTPGAELVLVVHRRSGELLRVAVSCRLDTAEEVSVYEAGGVYQATAPLSLVAGYQYTTFEGHHWHEVALGTHYALSKRTDVYAAVDWMRASNGVDAVIGYSFTPSTSRTQAAARIGMRHNF